MAGYVSGDSSTQHGVSEKSVMDRGSQDPPSNDFPGRWYMSRKDIEENSPSRHDGIDLKKETYIRKSYCTFLQDLGMRLKVPQVTIATAIVFCHRFFLRQSLAKNDRRTIATVCMFLAGKVEETPRPLKDVILVSYEIINKKDSVASQRIKQKEVYEQQKELILLGERVVLATLAFDFNVHHPYKPLVEAIKKFKVAQNALAQVAWNFVNDGLRTSLCLQFKPHHIAAGAIFLAAKFLKVKLPSDGEKVWWQEFDVTPRQLEEVSNQMLELYEQNKLPQGSEIEGSTGAVHKQRGPPKASAVKDEMAPSNGHAPGGTGEVSSMEMPGVSKQTSSWPGADHAENQNAPSTTGPNPTCNDDGSTEMNSVITENKLDAETKDDHRAESSIKCNTEEAYNRSEAKKEQAGDDEKPDNGGKTETLEAGEWRGGSVVHRPEGGIKLEAGEAPVTQGAIKLDTDKLKAAIEKRKKSRPDIACKKEVVDEDDLIERAVEDGIELAVKDEWIKQERRQSWPKKETHYHSKDQNSHSINKGKSRRGTDGNEFAEEGEMLDVANDRKRKGSPVDRGYESKHRRDYVAGHHRSDYHSHDDGHQRSDYHSHDDGHRAGKIESSHR